MSETVFSCGCGMILKVYGDDQTGKAITCPACSASVVVPGAGEAGAVPVPSGQPAGDPAIEEKPASVFALVYLAGTGLATILCVALLLWPAINRPRIAKAAVTEESTPVDPLSKNRSSLDAKLKVRKGPKSPSATRPALAAELPDYSLDPAPGPTPARSVAATGNPAAGVSPSPPPRALSPAAPPSAATPAASRFSMVAQNLMKQGRAFEKARKLDSALRTYHDIVDHYPGTDQATSADARIKFLEKK